jgi:dephospho-CoA kinase
MTSPNPIIVALVGGVGSGKSAAAAEFARRGAVVIDGDALGHKVLRDPVARDAVVSRFGPGVLDGDNHIDRRKLGAVVFAEPERRKELEAIVHPLILARIEDAIAQARRDTAPAVVLDAAVLLEAGWKHGVSKLVFVEAPADVRLQRVKGRGWSEDEWRRREAAQLPLTQKREKADHVLDNSSDQQHLGRQVADLMRLWGLTPREART